MIGPISATPTAPSWQTSCPAITGRSGVDEHGQKVEEAAKKRGMTPQAHCDDMQRHFRDLWPTLDVSNDDFIRTTEPRHEAVVTEALQRLWDRGEIYRGE